MSSADIDKHPEQYDVLMEELQKLTDNPDDVLKEKKELLAKYTAELSLKATLQNIREWVPDTPEEQTTLELAIHRTQRKVLLFSLIGMGITGTISYVQRANHTRFASTLMVGAGALMGALQGVIQSNKSSLALFDDLGTDYRLGQIAEEERMHWHVDEDSS
mmetsp:Transcript_13546/g.25529  ORF Transcript_13546/g.25529 Transcript_13546/m.25529 type:complete len:161 (+) Transcript_13546:2317-2799(+)|eukprot:CAMPEP_0204901666 /NCGR_PEP_ID=MMETSP1397-20131031/3212_1 /ASSEMBLY_ACC=CAM_ASM_000891 /TAXON_ID=49980 /ORGANISM="Climacostomum Climacostomum virens, Strain Stock W-24" /LENGTH=160 /DNA_ID=CAMNT_0052070053 /DNA_START=17 /DNA_END=499 /DNA_ORIENTATION=-